MSWKLPWHYLATTACVLEARKANTSQHLCEAIAGDTALMDQILTNQATPTQTGPVSVLLSKLKASVDATVPPAGRKAWTLSDLSGLNVELRRMESPTHPGPERAREYVLTPTTLYVPWPLFGDSASECSAAIVARATSKSTIPEVLDLAQLGEPWMLMDATLDAVDALLYCANGGFGTDVRASIDARAVALGRTYPLGTFTPVLDTGTLHKSDTRLVMGESQLSIDIGQTPDPEINGVSLVPAWPCGALTNRARPSNRC